MKGDFFDQKFYATFFLSPDAQEGPRQLGTKLSIQAPVPQATQ